MAENNSNADGPPKKKLFGSGEKDKKKEGGEDNADKKEDEKEDFFESKLFRLLCVGIYLAGVGGLGFTISLYHLFFWDSRMPEYHLKTHSG